MDNDTLHIMIERYFEGETSLEEEKRLLDTLIAWPVSDPEIDEALAVMGYARMKSENTLDVRVLRIKKRWRTAIISVAASVAVLIGGLGITAYFIYDNRNGISNECIAYIGGQQVHDRELIIKLVEGQLNEMSEANDDVSRIIEDDLVDMREMFNANWE